MKRTIILLVICMLLFAGCSTKGADNFSPKTYATDATQIKTIKIDVRDREIEVSVSKDSQIHIDYYESDKEYYDLAVSGDELVMTAAVNKEWTDYVGGKASAEYRKIALQISDNLISSLVLSTTNGDISLSELTAKENISLSNNGGNISFDKLSVEKSATFSAKNGDIKGTIKGSSNDFTISSEVKKGKSNLPENMGSGEKSLTVTMNNGDTNIDFTGNQ